MINLLSSPEIARVRIAHHWTAHKWKNVPGTSLAAPVNGHWGVRGLRACSWLLLASRPQGMLGGGMWCHSPWAPCTPFTCLSSLCFLVAGVSKASQTLKFQMVNFHPDMRRLSLIKGLENNSNYWPMEKFSTQWLLAPGSRKILLVLQVV